MNVKNWNHPTKKKLLALVPCAMLLLALTACNDNKAGSTISSALSQAGSSVSSTVSKVESKVESTLDMDGSRLDETNSAGSSALEDTKDTKDIKDGSSLADQPDSKAADTSK